MVLSGATALYIGNTSYSKAYVGDIQVWPVNNTDYSKEYLTFEIISAGTIMFTSNSSSAISKEIQYSINNGAWETIDSVSNSGFTVSEGDIVRFKGTNARYGTPNSTAPNEGTPRATLQNSTAVFNVYGNIMSLVYGDNFIGQTALDSGGFNFTGFFGATKVVSAENLILPMETIPPYAFADFMTLSTVTIAPKSIPATTIMEGGMRDAFWNCNNLTTASEFSATTVGRLGLAYTYLGCNSLTQGPSILPIQNMGIAACKNMFQFCDSLITAPELPCKTISQEGYKMMFERCRLLNYVKCLAENLASSECTNIWLKDVSSSGTFVKKAGVSWPSGSNGIPNNWTVIEE